MTGDAPQPGETPRTESDAWSFADPDADGASLRARHPRRRAPLVPEHGTGGTGTLLPPGADPHAYERGARDAAQELDPAIKQRGPVVTEQPRDPAGQERDHDLADSYRYDPLRPPAGLTTSPPADLAAGRVAPPEPPAASPEPPAASPMPPVASTQPPAASTQPSAASTQPPAASTQPPAAAPESPAGPPEPDVMVLPEPSPRNRPTVSLGPVPGQGRGTSVEPLPRSTGDPITDARLDLLENSPFWLEEHERPAGLALPEPSTHTRGARRSPRHAVRRPGPALFALVTLALLASFFAWVSAEPFWLAVGHGTTGRATTAACVGHGVTQRCTGSFIAADGHFAVARIALLGVAEDQRAGGAVSDARMVSRDSREAYLGSTGVLLHLRWVLGFLLVLICGYGIASLTGARRLGEARARRLAVLLSLAGPLALLAGFLAVTY